MAYHFTRSRARSELEGSDIEPSDVAPVAATSSSMSTESAGPMSAPTHPLPAGSPPSSGVLGVSGPAGPPQVGVSSLGYPSGLAGPSEVSEHSSEQSSSSIATVVDVPPSSSLAAAFYQHRGSRPPPPPRRLPLKVLHLSLTVAVGTIAPKR